ncbi:MAG: hypothetical protein ACRYGP_25550 [Janthinobacterium lividum]
MSDTVTVSEPGSDVSGRTKVVGVKESYALSLLWLALTFAVIAILSNVTELVFVDFIHGNPYRPKSNAIEMMWLFSIPLSIIAIIGCFLVFSLPQIAQAFLHSQTKGFSRQLSHLSVLSAIPFIAVLTWYCWEYLTPTDFNLSINEGPDWVPYQHGITLKRYLSSLAFQIPISLYSIIYCEPDIIKTSRRTVVVFGLVSAIIIGVYYGHLIAGGQYGFLGG